MQTGNPTSYRKGLAVLICGLLLAFRIGAQTNVLVAFSTTNSTPLNLGYAGFTTELLGTGIKYGDTNMQRAATQLSPGWLLYPGGTSGDAFNWTNGLSNPGWITKSTRFYRLSVP